MPGAEVAQHFRDGQDLVAVGHRGHHPVQDEPGGVLDVFLVAGGAEPAAFAGEGQQILVLAAVAADPGEAAFEVAAFEEFVDDFGDDGAQAAIARLVSRRVNRLKLAVVAVGALPERRLLRIPGAVNLH